MRSTVERNGEADDDVTALLRADLARYTHHATSSDLTDTAPGLTGIAPNPTDDSAAASAAAPRGAVSAAVRIDRIAALEQLRSAVAAAQNAEIVAFGRGQVEAQIAQIENGLLDPAAIGRGIADQIALACRISPHQGSRRLENARALAADLPATAALLAAGRISERVAELVVSQTRHLDAELRRLVDTQLAAAGLEELSVGRAEALAKKYAYDADPAAYVTRGRTARTDRRVGLRPAPDTMSVLSGLLPVEQGVACLAALRSHTDAVIAAGEQGGRTRDQVMADTFVERLTGQATASDVNVEAGIVMGLDVLLDPDSGGSAEIVGHGPVPAGIARDILATTNHPPAPGGRAGQLGQRARGVRPRQLRPRNARLDHRPGR